MNRARYWLQTVTMCALVSPCVASGQEGGRPTLRLRNGGYVSGQLRASDDAESIVWQGDGFTRPLRFPLNGVHSLQYPQPSERAPAIGPYGFELSGGDTLIGQLISLDGREAVLEIPPIGRVSVERSALRRFYRMGAADLIYSGPNGLVGWTTAGPEHAWRDEGGHLTSDVTGAAIGRQDRPPPVVCYEITLAWSDQPSFEFLAGLSQHVAGRTAFRLATWDDQLVVTRESDTQADVAVVQKIAPGAGMVALSVMFDESQGRLIVSTLAGEQVADFTVPLDKNPPKPVNKRQGIVRQVPGAQPQPEPPPSALLLTNLRGKLTLQHLTIRRWSGIAPKPALATEATIELKEGKNQSAEIRAFDAGTRQLVIVKDGKEQRIDEVQLQDVRFSQRDEPRQPAVTILLKNGVRLSGDLKQIGQDALVLQSPAIKQPVTLPVKDLQALVLLGTVAASDEAQNCRLELPGVSLRGNLHDARQAEDSSLVFQPAGSSVASPLAADVVGKLIFREAPPVAKPDPLQPRVEVPPRGAVVPAPAPFGLGLLFGIRQPGTSTVKPKPPGDCLLHLRTGDTLPCQVESIDERGVTFKSANTEAVFAPHERIKALELRLDVKPVKIQKTRFDRLLTLPRLQRDNPPEHLIRSLEGDYLRGRIIAMHDNVLEVEMRLEGKKIARDQVTRILWLHPDESAKAAVAKPAETADQKLPAGIRVQAVPRTGNRLTFFAQELTGKTLSGQSEVLGACHLEIDQLDQLLLGAAIEEAAATLAFHQWKLRAAAEPLPDPDPYAGSGEGLESALVG